MPAERTIEQDILADLRPAERNYEFLERVAIIEEACRVSPVEALFTARRQRSMPAPPPWSDPRVCR